jgi:hypothetical protein
MVRFPLVCLLAVLLSVAPARAAEPSPWATTFTPETLATWLGSTPARCLVVPAGDDSPERALAQQALSGALRASDQVPLVMGAEALGPLASLDDVSIARRGAALPVDRVWVLRLYPDAAGALTRAVVTLYTPSGESLGSFLALAGVALAPRATEPAAPVARRPAPGPPSEAQKQYEEQYIGFPEIVSWTGTTSLIRWVQPYEGKYQKPLEDDAFYRKLKRLDLAEAYQNKQNTRVALGVLGGGAVVGGIVLMFSALEDPEEIYRVPVGGVVMTAGLVGMLVGAYMNPHPVTPSEARRLADEYNETLRGGLGLPSDAVEPVKPKPVIQARLSPVWGPDGAGLRLQGTF